MNLQIGSRNPPSRWTEQCPGSHLDQSRSARWWIQDWSGWSGSTIRRLSGWILHDRIGPWVPLGCCWIGILVNKEYRVKAVVWFTNTSKKLSNHSLDWKYLIFYSHTMPRLFWGSIHHSELTVAQVRAKGKKTQPESNPWLLVHEATELTLRPQNQLNIISESDLIFLTWISK